ncbi:MAG TPA: tetratricopeptide repeat protein [bacterium]|nr:tetratricopeptide repeat protein [bacterium]
MKRLIYHILSASIVLALTAGVCGAKPKAKKAAKKTQESIAQSFESKDVAVSTDAAKQFTAFALSAKEADELVSTARSIRKRVYACLSYAGRWKRTTLIKVFPNEKEYRQAVSPDCTDKVSWFLFFRERKIRVILACDGAPDLQAKMERAIVQLVIADIANEGFFRGQSVEEKIPLWFSVGFAEYMTASKKRRAAYEELLYAALYKKLLPPVADIVDTDRMPEGAEFFTAYSYSLVAYLARMPHAGSKFKSYITTSMSFGPERRLIKAFPSEIASLPSFDDAWQMNLARRYAKGEGEWSAQTLTEVASLYYEAGEYSEAVRYATRAAKRNPRIARANHVVGMSEYKRGNKTAALAAFDKELKTDPSNAQAAFMKGVISWKTGKRNAAIAAFSAAAKQNRIYEPIMRKKKGKTDINNDVVASFLRFTDREE